MVDTLIGCFQQVFQDNPILREICDPGAERKPYRRLARDRISQQAVQQALDEGWTAALVDALQEQDEFIPAVAKRRIDIFLYARLNNLTGIN